MSYPVSGSGLASKSLSISPKRDLFANEKKQRSCSFSQERIDALGQELMGNLSFVQSMINPSKKENSISLLSTSAPASSPITGHMGRFGISKCPPYPEVTSPPGSPPIKFCPPLSPPTKFHPPLEENFPELFRSSPMRERSPPKVALQVVKGIGLSSLQTLQKIRAVSEERLAEKSLERIKEKKKIEENNLFVTSLFRKMELACGLSSQIDVSSQFYGVVSLAKRNFQSFFGVWQQDFLNPNKINIVSEKTDTEILRLLQVAAKLLMVFVDVDGTLISKMISVSQVPLYNGEDSLALRKISKDLRDGFGCHTVILTGNPNPKIVTRIASVAQVPFEVGVKDKMKTALEYFDRFQISSQRLTFREKCYFMCAIGDDKINEEQLMRFVSLPVCPSSVRPEMLDLCSIVTPHEGGNGAVRDLLEFVIFAKIHRSELLGPETILPVSTQSYASKK